MAYDSLLCYGECEGTFHPLRGLSPGTGKGWSNLSPFLGENDCQWWEATGEQTWQICLAQAFSLASCQPTEDQMLSKGQEGEDGHYVQISKQE